MKLCNGFVVTFRATHHWRVLSVSWTRQQGNSRLVGKAGQPLQSVKFDISVVLTDMRDLDPHMINLMGLVWFGLFGNPMWDSGGWETCGDVSRS